MTKPDVTKVYVDNEYCPVFDKKIAAKIGFIDLAQQEAEGIKQEIRELIDIQTIFSSTFQIDAEYALINTAGTAALDIREVWRMSDALENIKNIKDAAELKDPPKGFLVKGVILLLKNKIWDPMDTVKDDCQKEILSAMDSYALALRLLNNNQNEITTYEVAHDFLVYYLYVKGHSQVAISLNQKIFKNYRAVLEKWGWIIAGWVTKGFSDFAQLGVEAKRAVDWAWDATFEWITAISNAQFQLWPYRLHEAAPYTLELAQCFRIDVEVHSPVEVRVYDSEERVTGVVNGEEKNEIPYSVYNDNSVKIFSPTDSYKYEVSGTSKGSYDIAVTTIAEEINTFLLEKEPISAKAIHQYTIDWEALSEGKKGVTVKIDSDGDGAFEEIRYLGEEKAGFPWVLAIVVALSGIVGVLVGAFIIRRYIYRRKENIKS